MNGGISNHKIAFEVFHFHRSPPWLESLTCRFLAVPVPSNVGSLVTHAEGPLAEFPVGDSDILRGQIGSGGRRIRHGRIGSLSLRERFFQIGIDQLSPMNDTKTVKWGRLPDRLSYESGCSKMQENLCAVLGIDRLQKRYSLGVR